jgi:alpha-tubulin suppressor-like RCC1 family protein
LGTNKTVIETALGDFHSCALLNDFTVKCWGYNDKGQLGRDNTTSVGDGVGTAMSSLTSINLGTNKTAIKISAGFSNSCAILNDGSAKCWGDNNFGQLGQDSRNNAGDGGTFSTPMASLSPINLGTNKTAIQVSPGDVLSCAVLNDGAAKCWGSNYNGQLGQESTTTAGDGAGISMASLPSINLGTDKSALRISAGTAFACALLTDGTVKCWGNNVYGQLGQDSTAAISDGTGSSLASLTPIYLGTNRTAIQISAGNGFACALLNNGSTKCWGRNNWAQLGIDSSTQVGDGAGIFMNALGAIAIP